MPPCVALCNPKPLFDKLVGSKLRPDYEEERGVFICGQRNCDICNILEPGNEFKSTTTGEVYKINFHFHCNSECTVYLLTCMICRKQYVGPTITKFRLRFNQYKFNIKLYGKGRRNFKQEKFTKHFYSENHNSTHQDINVKIIGFCDPNDQEKCGNFWLNKLRTLYPLGLNYKQINHY